MNISLYNIESALSQLMDLRELAEAEGDSEAIAVADREIKAYLQQEATKVTSYVGLIRNEMLSAQACEEESERFRDMAKRKRATIDRLKAIALEAMQAFDVKELKATPGGGLRRQGNGGVQALEISEWPKDHSGNYVPQSEHYRLPGIQVKTFVLPDTVNIREHLAAGEKLSHAKLLERGEHIRVI